MFVCGRIVCYMDPSFSRIAYTQCNFSLTRSIQTLELRVDRQLSMDAHLWSSNIILCFDSPFELSPSLVSVWRDRLLPLLRRPLFVCDALETWTRSYHRSMDGSQYMCVIPGSWVRVEVKERGWRFYIELPNHTLTKMMMIIEIWFRKNLNKFQGKILHSILNIGFDRLQDSRSQIRDQVARSKSKWKPIYENNFFIPLLRLVIDRGSSFSLPLPCQRIDPRDRLHAIALGNNNRATGSCHPMIRSKNLSQPERKRTLVREIWAPDSGSNHCPECRRVEPNSSFDNKIQILYQNEN